MCAECHYTNCPSGCPNAPEPKYPVCPVCNEQADTFYKHKGEILGCDSCIETMDAWECEDED